MKCVVTGAAGYIGNVLCRDLHASGYNVAAFVQKTDDITHILDICDIVPGDVRDESSLCAAFADADAVVHCAGIVDIGTRNKALMEKVNVGGTINVVEACKKCGVKRLLYVSSVHALPALPSGQTMAEITGFDPALVEGDYAKTKATATARVLQAAKNGLDAVVVHPSGIVGPFDYGISSIGQLIIDFLCGRLRAYIDGMYSFVDVRDVSQGIMRALTKGRAGECYILSGEIVTVPQLLATVSEASDKTMPRIKLPYWFAYGTGFLAEQYYRLLHQRPVFTAYSVKTLRTNCSFSSEKAKNELGLTFIPMETSLTDMTHWIMAHHLIKENGKFKRKTDD